MQSRRCLVRSVYQKRIIAFSHDWSIESGYDQLAAIYALEHANNDVEKAIKILADCGMIWEDIDGRQEAGSNEQSAEEKGKEKDNSSKGVVSAIGNYLRSSVFVSKGKEKEYDVADETDEDKIKNNNFLAIMMYYMLSRIRNCMNFCIMCDTRLMSR